MDFLPIMDGNNGKMTDEKFAVRDLPSYFRKMHYTRRRVYLFRDRAGLVAMFKDHRGQTDSIRVDPDDARPVTSADGPELRKNLAINF